jgi:hypothetical protein
VEKGKLRQETSGGVVAANVTPQPPQISLTTLATPPSSALTVEQMRTAGAIAGARQKVKLATNKRL